MVTVCVLGGGKAGRGAAIEAARCGARVTLLERASHLGADWLDGVRFSNPVRDEAPVPTELGVDVRLGEEVISVDRRLRVTTSRSTRGYDSVVVATGSSPDAQRLHGSSKRGVFLLGGRESRVSLIDGLPRNGLIAVAAEGIEGFLVADALASTGHRVTLFAGQRWWEKFPVPGVESLLCRAGACVGVDLLADAPSRVLGVGTVEAVSASGIVVPCQSLVIVPRFVPSLPNLPVEVGSGGVVVVDEKLRSSVEGLYAAGGCAEVAPPNQLSLTSRRPLPSISGRVAGANAAGQFATFSSPYFFNEAFFGVRLVCAGLTYDEAVRLGFGPGSASSEWDEGSRCWVVYRRSDLRVLGVQLTVDNPGPTVDPSLAILGRITLRDLAYSSSPSIDISLVSEAAREALRREG